MPSACQWWLKTPTVMPEIGTDSVVDPMPPFANDQVIGSIPVLSSTAEQAADYTDLIHLNVRNNPSSFAVVPVSVGCVADLQVVRSQTMLLQIRQYLDTVLFAHLSPRPGYAFLSRTGGRIAREQEAEVLAWNEVLEEEWTHHTFSAIVTRYHLFIVLEASDVMVGTK